MSEEDEPGKDTAEQAGEEEEREAWIEQLVAEDAETFRKMLRLLVNVSEVSLRSLDRRIGLGRGYVANVLSGKVEMKQRHVSAILAATGIHPSLFYDLVYPRHRPFGPIVATSEFARRFEPFGLFEPPDKPLRPVPEALIREEIRPYVAKLVREALAQEKEGKPGRRPAAKRAGAKRAPARRRPAKKPAR